MLRSTMRAHPEPRARRIRVVRGVLASSTATAAALVSHLVAGGSVPVPAVVAAVLVLGWLPGVALIGRRPTLARQAAVIVPVEAALHLAFSVPVAVATGTSDGPRTTASVHTHMVAMGPLRTMSGMHASPLMWVGHAVAALLTLLAWRTGEQAVRRLAALVALGGRRLLGRVAVVRALPLRRPAVRIDRTTVPPRVRTVVAVAPRRGPPRVA